MIQLTSKTTIGLLLVLMKQNYGKAWFSESDKKGFISVGIHAPTGEIGYYIPEEYLPYMRGMVKLPADDLITTSFADDAAERLIQWSEQL